jgi:hypothetical protein
MVAVALAGSVLAIRGAIEGIRGSIRSTVPGVPAIVLQSVEAPSGSTGFLRLSFEVANSGATTIALSQTQFLIRIFSADQQDLFYGEPVFAQEIPKVITLKPGATFSVTVTTRPDSALTKYCLDAEVAPRVQIRLNSGKAQQFPDQRLGGTYSNELRLRPDP